ncbi:acyl-CoA dehydrogenase [Sphingomonas populi]|uniref:Acyl-CoA dehydrogenase n=1 Tax=Sphingomonas populi TaxID=2484750 RepID=A0A4Q6XGL2_9SPHN|nr:acyl-CoA dehydrogenase family protein [Sphingomonas populi]RZF58633.1 acyl-CoA dehydrogenase [Sphingomonas populi]
MANKLATVQSFSPAIDEGLGETIVKRAHDMIPELVARQAETEARTHYAPDTHSAFEKAGFYNILVPKEFSGLDLDVKTYYRVVMELATGCPSTAWQFCLGSAHAVTLCGMFDLPTQRQVFDLDEPFICAVTARPQGEARRRVDGDWDLNGVFNFCSGIPYSSHFMSHAIAVEADGSPAGIMTFVARRDQWTMLDDWGGSLGLKGSGSNSVSFTNAHVPAALTRLNKMHMEHRLEPKSEATAHLDNPIYYGGTMSLWLLEPAALLLGMVKGALDECTSLMATKMTAIPPIQPRVDSPDYQRWFGAAATKIALAEAAYYDACEKWTEDARLQMLGHRDPADPRENLAMVMCGEIIEMCWDAMQLLYRTAGTSSAFDGQRFQRIYRDMSTARSHAYNTRFDQLHRDLAKLLITKAH